jgi:hypothetical protein
MSEMSHTPSVEELLNRGVGFHEQGNIEAARLHYDGALLSQPDHPAALMNLSAALLSGRMDYAALSVSNRAISLAPDNLGAYINKAGALYALGHFEAALEINQEILAKDPNIAGVWHNSGIVNSYMNEFENALRLYDKALTLPMSPPAEQMVRSDRALSLLSLGRLKEGIEAYRVRWEKLYKPKVWQLGIPIWWDCDLRGARLLVHHEQGFGDGIMLCRFLPMLKELGISDLVVAAPEELRDLFEPFGYPVEDWNDEVSLREHNCSCFMPMLDILGALELTPDMISSDRYIRASTPKFKLGPDGFRVGICWSSGDHGFAISHRRRYVPLEKFFPLAEIPGVRLVGLQKGHPEKDILNLGAESFIFDPMPRCGNFAQTAQVIQGLDLVISVDSAIAHLAGALGKPCWMLGPYARCWRWWEGMSGSPWYENFNIYTQGTYNNWDIPMNTVIEDMQVMAADLNLKAA